MGGIAALDLGTNNCRLLLAMPEGPAYRTICSFSKLVRLGEGVNESGRLNEAAMERTVAALSECAMKIQHFRPSHARYVATAACRKANNAAQFVRHVKQTIGLDLEIISPRQEASLAMAACFSVLDVRRSHALILDIGGGSTEIVWVSLNMEGGSELIDWDSLPCGVVALAERNSGHPKDLQSYKQVVKEVKELLMPFEASNNISSEIAGGNVQMIGMSGTIATLSAIHLNLEKYDSERVDGIGMSRKDVFNIIQELKEKVHGNRVEHPCIRVGQEDLIIPGCAILQAILETWPVSSVSVTNRSLTDGLVASMLPVAASENKE